MCLRSKELYLCIDSCCVIGNLLPISTSELGIFFFSLRKRPSLETGSSYLEMLPSDSGKRLGQIGSGFHYPRLYTLLAPNALQNYAFQKISRLSKGRLKVSVNQGYV